jgi:hypothetical protein
LCKAKSLRNRLPFQQLTLKHIRTCSTFGERNEKQRDTRLASSNTDLGVIYKTQENSQYKSISASGKSHTCSSKEGKSRDTKALAGYQDRHKKKESYMQHLFWHVEGPKTQCVVGQAWAAVKEKSSEPNPTRKLIGLGLG